VGWGEAAIGLAVIHIFEPVSKADGDPAGQARENVGKRMRAGTIAPPRTNAAAAAGADEPEPTILGRTEYETVAAPPMTFGASAVAGLRPIVRHRACRHQVEPDPALLARIRCDTIPREWHPMRQARLASSGNAGLRLRQEIGVHRSQGWALASRRVKVLVIYSPTELCPKTLRGPSNIANWPLKRFRDSRWKGLHVCQQILCSADAVLQDRAREFLGQKELVSGDMGVQITRSGLLMSRLDRQGVHFHTPSTVHNVSSSHEKLST
jgi:hypothetical protein